MTPSYTRSAAQQTNRRRATRMRRRVALASCALVIIGAAATLAITKPWATSLYHSTQSVHYVGVYEPDAPGSYDGVNQFAQAIGRQPNLVSYYSPWLKPFQASFAVSAAKHGATTVIQIDPEHISLASIVSGHYDGYIRSYATEIKSFRTQVVISFGHEMNGNWYTWANENTSPAVFVAAWRHVVNLFRTVGAGNVTWMWTVNVIDTNNSIPDPTPWWPGRAYVNWVGIDGYYYQSSQTFAQVFSPTVIALLKLTSDPIIIAETGAAPTAGQPAKINDLFNGIRSFGLAGFMWFDENTQGRVWRISDPSAFTAFRQDAKKYMKPPAQPRS